MAQAAQPSTVVDVVVINIVIVINIVVLMVTMVVIVTATLVVGVVVIMVANRIRFRFRIVPIRRAVHRSCTHPANPVLSPQTAGMLLRPCDVVTAILCA
jgi:hypothetical protein